MDSSILENLIFFITAPITTGGPSSVLEFLH